MKILLGKPIEQLEKATLTEIDLSRLPTLIGLSDELDTLIESILREPNNLKYIGNLSYHMKIRVWFKNPARIRINFRKYKIVSVYDFPRISFEKGNTLYYAIQGKRYYYPLYETITKIEPLTNKTVYFTSYDEFKKKFDTKFITEKMIKTLWNEKSSQHGHKYCKKDFRKLNIRGREVMSRFLERFEGIPTTPPEVRPNDHYKKSPHGNYWVLEDHYDSYQHPGRDIKISHQTNCSHVHYSTEYYKCLNGRYGLVANKHEFLHLEDD